MPSQADGFGVAPSILGQQIIGMAVGRIHDGAGKDASASRHAEADNCKRENGLHIGRELEAILSLAVQSASEQKIIAVTPLTTQSFQPPACTKSGVTIRHH